jgi:hypothetical protein
MQDGHSKVLSAGHRRGQEGGGGIAC